MPFETGKAQKRMKTMLRLKKCKMDLNIIKVDLVIQ